jgi:molybdopterin-guanine dinucleotide biosynthesis protein B
VLGLAGWSGSGKTWLVTRLIPVLNARGIAVSTIKHAHERFDVDLPGKDSYEHRAAGAREVLVSSVNRFALIRELRGARELGLADALRLLAPVDLVLVEGFKSAHHHKLEVFRAGVGKPLLFEHDESIRALVSDAAVVTALPQARFDDLARIADLALAAALPLDVTLARL